jgi:hypothetical protein
VHYAVEYSLGILSVLDIKEKIYGVKEAPKDDKRRR